jgi:hypothetical protein
MLCTVCSQRPSRRACPALRSDICSVCCGTKRQREIDCPLDCPYLVTAQAHPAAVVRRQHEDDLKMFLPTVRDLTEPQADLLRQVLSFIRMYRGDALMKTIDADVEAAASALAATYDTAARGLIYEQRPNTLPAQRLAGDLKMFVSKAGGDRGTSLDRDLATVFHAVEVGARDAQKTLPGKDSAYLELIRRLIVPGDPPGHDDASATGSPGQGGSLLVRP